MQQQPATPTTITTNQLRINTDAIGVHNAAIIATCVRAHNFLPSAASHFIPEGLKQPYTIGNTAQRDARYSAAEGKAIANMPELRSGRAPSSSLAVIVLQYEPS